MAIGLVSMEAQEKLKLNPQSDINLNALNLQTTKNSYSIKDIDWSLKVGANKFWLPEHLVSISHLPVYQEMSPDLRRIFNQYNSLGVSELFIFFEEKSLIPCMTKALAIAQSDPLKLALQNFIDEEYKHSECFKKLLKNAAPQMYPDQDLKFLFVKVPLISRIMLMGLKKFSVLLPAWVWAAIFFEERTLMYSREFIKAKKENPESIDELFYQTHFYHMLDEIRHVKLDEHLIENFYKTSGKIHSKFVAWMVYRFLKRSAHPINMIRACLAQIKKFHPQLLSAEIEYKIISQSKMLPKTKSFTDLNFGDSAAPRTRQLMNRFPEFKNFWIKIIQQEP